MTFWSQFATEAGDGTGSIQATGDYSVTAAHFKVQPAQDEIVSVARLLILVGDASIVAERYGGIIGGLTNGIKLRWRNDDGDEIDLLGGNTVKTNVDWARHCYDVEAKQWGAGDEFITVRWTFSKSGAPINLVGYRAERIVVTLSDDMSALELHTFLFQGQVSDYYRGKYSDSLKTVPLEPA